MAAVRFNDLEPPCTDPYARWCGRGRRATAAPMPIRMIGINRIRTLEGKCHKVLELLVRIPWDLRNGAGADSPLPPGEGARQRGEGSNGMRQILPSPNPLPEGEGF